MKDFFDEKKSVTFLGVERQRKLEPSNRHKKYPKKGSKTKDKVKLQHVPLIIRLDEPQPHR